MRRPALAVLLTSGLALAAIVRPAPAQPPASTPATAQPAAEPAPKSIPVPDGPVLKKIELDGGLIVEDIKIGDGYEVKDGGAVVAHYHGTLKADGKIFDSSFARGEPAAFPLSGVIQGWQKGVPGMKVGGVRRLTVPAAMGYGPQAMGDSIPANSDLVFVIELVDALQIQDLEPGTGEAAADQFVAATAQTIKGSDGHELSKADAAHPYIWIPGEIFVPDVKFDVMQAALNGMKVGGKRRVCIPKEMNISPPQLQVARAQKVPLTIDLELVSVRNLPSRRR